MKSLAQLSNVEKAKILHQLFPFEIPELLQYLKEICDRINNDQEAVRLYWESTWCTADYWITLSNNAISIIEKYGPKLEKSSRLFADQLFKGDTTLYTIECIVKYASRKSHNEEFIKAVALLFG